MEDILAMMHKVCRFFIQLGACEVETYKDLQGMLDQVEAALSLWDRFKRWRRTGHESVHESIAGRFCRVFASHGVHRNQIPRFFGYGLTLEDVQSDVSLFPKLDEQLLDAVCERFAIRREWLDGADKQAHPTHSFYKHPSEFASFIKNLRNGNSDGELGGVVIAPSDNDGNAEALLILEERVGWVGQKPICRYHLCNDWAFSYWKARAYLTACVAIAWKQEVYVRGSIRTKKEIDLLSGGEYLLGWGGEGFGSIGHRQWDPEDMALWPERFLSGIDPERGKFGIRSGLQLWLTLQQEGLMDTGLSVCDESTVRGRFESELARIPESA